ELPVRVHRDGVTDGPQHREVGRGVAVRVRGLEIDPPILGERSDRLCFRDAIAVELELARVAPLLDPRTRREDPSDAEMPRERADDLLRRRANDEVVTPPA